MLQVNVTRRDISSIRYVKVNSQIFVSDVKYNHSCTLYAFSLNKDHSLLAQLCFFHMFIIEVNKVLSVFEDLRLHLLPIQEPNHACTKKAFIPWSFRMPSRLQNIICLVHHKELNNGSSNAIVPDWDWCEQILYNFTQGHETPLHRRRVAVLLSCLEPFSVMEHQSSVVGIQRQKQESGGGGT